MITFDSLTLKLWIEENKDFLTGARIQKIQQPTRRDFVFSIRKQGETKKLYININPQLHHVCFMSKDNETKRMIEIPQKPPMFCMLLRKYLENSVIAKVNQPPFERILEFYIETYNELSEKIYLCLAIELMGKHSNIILYNYDTNVIVGCAHNVGAEKSREREMAGGLPYIYPPGAPKEWYAGANSFSNTAENINQRIDDYYADCIYKDKFINLRHYLSATVNSKLKKSKSSYDKMQYRLKEQEDADKYRLFGDLIMANLYNNSDYSKSIEVFDYENNKNIKLALDESLTLKDNANKFYKLYNKSKTSISKLGALSQDLYADIVYLEQVIYSIEAAENIDDLLEIKNEIIPCETKKENKKSAVEPLETEIDGVKIYIGKNNRQNDYIVSKLAKDEDYWFHTKDCAGSHVLLKSAEPSDKLILECVKLAKENSSAKNSSKIGVIYTKRKYLKKPPKAALGYVTYRNEKEIIL